MNAEQWKRVDALLARSAELAPEQREPFLRGACADDAELLDIVLSAASDSGRFLRPPSLQGLVTPGDEGNLTGRTLGEFHIRERLGSGGMGVVYRAVQSSLGREVAIKVLFGAGSSDATAIERLRREARAAAKLDHPGIVRILTVGRDSGIDFLAMELIRGPDLAAEIARLRRQDASPGVLPPFASSAYVRSAVEIVKQAAEALAFAHEHGIVHFDVKPANFLLDASGCVHVADFGLARDSSAAATRSRAHAGTPAYMSPERIQGDPGEVDARTDVYSLGVVLYELLALRRPFEGNIERVWLEIARDTTPRLATLQPRVPRDLELVCATAMARIPDERYATAAALCNDLRRFLCGEAVAARPRSMWRIARDFGRRRRLALSVAAAAFLALIAGSWLTSSAAHRAERAHWPSVSVRLSEETATQVASLSPGVRVIVRRRPINPLTGERGQALVLGAPPLVDENVEPGNWRWSVDIEGFGFSEHTRYLTGSTSAFEIIAHVRPTTQVVDGMQAIEGGTYSFGSIRPLGCISELPQSEVEAYWIDRAETSNDEYLQFLRATGRQAPKRWRSVGFVDDWRTLPLGRHAERFLDLPVIGFTYEDAQEFAEWCGKRLATHSELERALRGARRICFPDDDPTNARYGGHSCTRGADISVPITAEEHFAAYLENVLRVREPGYRQAPEGLFHAFGNVAEYTESLFAEPFEQGFMIQPLSRLYMGAMWDAELNRNSLEFHAANMLGESYIADYIGIRCCKSNGP